MTRILLASVLTFSLVAGYRAAAEASCRIWNQQVFPQAPIEQWNNVTLSYDSIPNMVGRNCGVHDYLRVYSNSTPASFANVVIRSEQGTHSFTVSQKDPINDRWTVTGYFEGQQGCTEQTMDVQLAHYVLTPTELLPANAMITVEGLEAFAGGELPASLPFQTDDSTDATCGLASLARPSCGWCPPPGGTPSGYTPAEADGGGCSVGGASALPSALLVLVPLAIRRRRLDPP
jgi:Synergist-CTERM protein sorting domain-containing protein